MHAAEAVHGDLGMITRDDVLIAISYSGSGQELLTILPVARRMGAKLVAITGNPQSELASLADVHLDASVAQEACPLNLAPTASTTAALAWAMRWPSPAWRRAASARRTSPARIPAARWVAAC